MCDSTVSKSDRKPVRAERQSSQNTSCSYELVGNNRSLTESPDSSMDRKTCLISASKYFILKVKNIIEGILKERQHLFSWSSDKNIDFYKLNGVRKNKTCHFLFKFKCLSNFWDWDDKTLYLVLDQRSFLFSNKNTNLWMRTTFVEILALINITVVLEGGSKLNFCVKRFCWLNTNLQPQELKSFCSGCNLNLTCCLQDMTNRKKYPPKNKLTQVFLPV